MNKDIRNRLWNIINRLIDDNTHHSSTGYDNSRFFDGMSELFDQLVDQHFCEVISDLPYDAVERKTWLKNKFFRMNDNQIKEFLGFLISFKTKEFIPHHFYLQSQINAVLKEGQSGYEYKAGKAVSYPSEEHCSAVKDALELPQATVTKHISKAN
jgi:hypothetical protein